MTKDCEIRFDKEDFDMSVCIRDSLDANSASVVSNDP